MPESNVNLIVKTKREGDAPEETLKDLKAMKTGLTDLEKAVTGTRTTVGGLGEDVGGLGVNLGSTADLMNGLGVSIPIDPMQLFGMAVKAGADYAHEAIDEYSSYVDEISKMASFTNTTTEEMSRMYQMTDDLRIGTSDLEMALKTMTQQGVSPSINGLATLSDEYLAIQDPIARSQFLIQNFGRSGQEMGRLMDLGSEAIRNQASEVEQWMIVTGQSEEQVNEYLKALDNWNDAMQRNKFQVAQIIPLVTTFANVILDANEETDIGNRLALDFIPILGGVKGAIDLITSVVGQQTKKADDLGDAWHSAADGVKDYASAAEAITANTHRGNTSDSANHGSIYDTTPLGGGMASGGDVYAGQTYKVGEREVEYITMGAQGVVTPSNGGGGPVNVTIDYHPAVSTMNRVEAETELIPLIQSALRRS